MANSKNTNQTEDSKAPVAALIAKARKEGSIHASELSAELEKLDLSVEKIEQIYDTFEAMGIQIIGAELELEMEEDAALEREKRRQQAVLSIRRKYGKNAILRGMNLEEGATARERNRQVGGHKA